MQIDRSQVKRILVITLSNVGDIILTTPVVRTLTGEFPGSRIDVMAGPKGREIFEKDPRVFKLIIYDKHMPMSEKRRLQLKLKRLKYDLVVDIRNTVFPLLIGPRFRTATIQKFPGDMIHRMERHTYLLKSLGLDHRGKRPYIYIPEEDERYVENLMKEAGVNEPFVVINPGAKSHLKRWMAEGFAQLADELISECGVSVVIAGAKEDEDVVSNVIKNMKHKAHDFTSKTNIRQLAGLLKRSKLVITNDSAPLHLACAVGVKVLALFGPTDPKKYGPTGEFDRVIAKKLSCSPCESAICKFNYECMKSISSDEAFDVAREMLEGYEQ